MTTANNGTPTPELRESLKAIQEATGQTPAQLKQTLLLLSETFGYMAEHGEPPRPPKADTAALWARYNHDYLKDAERRASQLIGMICQFDVMQRMRPTVERDFLRGVELTGNADPAENRRGLVMALQALTETPEVCPILAREVLDDLQQATREVAAYEEERQRVCEDVDAALAGRNQGEHTPPA